MNENEQVNVHTGELVPIGPVDTSMSVAQLEARLAVYDAVRTAAVNRLKENTDYGKPYDGAPKPCLLKAGAEKLNVFFGFGREIIVTERVEGEGYFEVRCTCRITRNGQLVATGTGSCNSREYRYDKQINPTKYDAQDQRRPMTVFDLKNTIEKIAAKRCFVDAILGATGLSDIYTQDLDDDPDLVRERSKPTGGNLKAMQSRYDGKCTGCGGAIIAGDDIMYQAGNKDKGIKALVYHPGCVGKTTEADKPADPPTVNPDGDTLATEKQLHAIDQYFANPKRTNVAAWWNDVKADCIETVTTGRAATMIAWLGQNKPETPIPLEEWSAMLSGGKE